MDTNQKRAAVVRLKVGSETEQVWDTIDVVQYHPDMWGISFVREYVKPETMIYMKNMFLRLATDFDCQPFLQGDWNEGFLIEFWTDDDHILDFLLELERVGWKLNFE